MAESSKVKTRVIVEQRVYRNIELALWIDSIFDSEAERSAAWKTAFHVGNMYPEIGEKIRGQLIDEVIEEDNSGNH